MWGAWTWMQIWWTDLRNNGKCDLYINIDWCGRLQGSSTDAERRTPPSTHQKHKLKPWLISGPPESVVLYRNSLVQPISLNSHQGGLLQCSCWHHDPCCLFLGISVPNREAGNGRGTGKHAHGGGWALPRILTFQPWPMCMQSRILFFFTKH